VVKMNGYPIEKYLEELEMMYNMAVENYLVISTSAVSNVVTERLIARCRETLEDMRAARSRIDTILVASQDARLAIEATEKQRALTGQEKLAILSSLFRGRLLQ
jgi:ribose 1,5-bisphosphokinase PhnN